MFLLQIQRRPELHVRPPKPVVLAVHTGHPWSWSATAVASAAAYGAAAAAACGAAASAAGGARRKELDCSHLKQRRHDACRGSLWWQHLDVHGLGGHVDGEANVFIRNNRLEQRRHEARHGSRGWEHLHIRGLGGHMDGGAKEYQR